MCHARDNQSFVDSDNFVNHNAHSMLATYIVAPNFTSPFNKDGHKLTFDIAMIVKEFQVAGLKDIQNHNFTRQICSS
jgi:hypothetical protein